MGSSLIDRVTELQEDKRINETIIRDVNFVYCTSTFYSLMRMYAGAEMTRRRFLLMFES